MAINQRNRPFERTPFAQPEVSIGPRAAEAREVSIHRTFMPRTRLVFLARAAGHYLGTTVRVYRTTRRDGVKEQARRVVRRYPQSLGGIAAAGYFVGRVLRGRT